MAAPSTGMDRAEMKSLLNKATPEKPINFALGLGKDPNFALLKLDRTKGPKMVDKQLSDQFADLKTSRWGTVSFDEADSTLKFMVNKPIASIAGKLVKTLKGTGFSKVQIVLEDGTVADSAGGDAEADDGDAAPVEATAPESSEPTPKPTPEPAPQPDRHALTAELAGLIAAIGPKLAADPALKAPLTQLATAANTALKTDLDAAPVAIAALRDALAAAPTAATAAGDRSKQDVTAALRELIGQIPAAIVADPATKDTLTKLAGSANAHLKDNDLAAADADIAKLREALQSGHGADARLTDLAAQASVLPEPTRSDLLGQVKQLRAQPDAAALDTLADAIVAATRAARTAEAQLQAGNTVSFRLLQKKWIDAEGRSQKEFDAFLDAMLSDPDLQADARFPDLQAEANDLASLIPDDGGTLTAALGALDDADDAARPQAQKKAAAALETYRADLAAAQEFKALQDVADEFYGGKPFFSELQSALTDLGAELAKRAA